MEKLPENFEIIYKKNDITKRSEELGAQITPWASSVTKASGKDVLAVAVLRGGIFFFADLVREIDASVEVAPVQSWAYSENEVISSEVRLNLEGVDPKGRSVLLIDDICDSGKTLKALCEAFSSLGATEVRTAVLIEREVENQIFEPDFVGFHYAKSEWFVGYGMDDNDRFKNLPDIYIMKRD